MQKLVTIYLSNLNTRHGTVEEHLADYMQEGWHVSSICPARAPTSKAGGIWLAVVLEKNGRSVRQTAASGADSEYVEYPEPDSGSPVGPSGVPVGPKTPLKVGSRVLSFWGGSWWRAEVIAIKKSTVRIHYTGWDSSWDTDVRRKSLQVDPTADEE
jgi:hypothetical protein